MNRSIHLARVVVVCAAAALTGVAANAQAPAPVAATAAATPSALDQLAWLRGCWGGEVNRRNFVEQWLPPRGGMMVGVSHTTVQKRKDASDVRTEDYTYLRLEARPDGVYYVAIPSGTKEASFKLTKVDNDQGDHIFTFSGPLEGFPQSIVYRHTEGGSLFATVAGKVDGQDKQVIYPMHAVDCTSGEPARK